MSHTKGPWFVVDTCHQMNFADTTVCHLKYVGQEKEFFIGSEATDHGDVEANAKLIAAAPELLRALQSIQGAEAWITDESVRDIWQKFVYPAINKATI